MNIVVASREGYFDQAGELRADLDKQYSEGETLHEK